MNSPSPFVTQALPRAALMLCLALGVAVSACGPAPQPTLTPGPRAVTATGAAAGTPTGLATTGPDATAAASASPTLPAASPTPAAPPKRFTIALADLPGSLDPALAADRSALLITRHLYEGLLTYEPGATKPAPALADRWEASADGLTWTFHLRLGVQFSDGAAFDAEAARLNFERWQNGDPPGGYSFWRAVFGGFAGEVGADGEPLSLLAGASAPASQTLVLSLTRPYAGLPNVLAMPSFAMVSPAAFQTPEAAARLESISAGTGPFVLAGAGAGPLVRLVRNPAYWGGHDGGPDELVFKTIPDDTQRLLALASGEIEAMSSVNPKDYGVVSAPRASTRLVFDPALDVVYLGFNQAHAPWDNADCRLAVAYALDKARYVQQAFPGDAQPALSILPPGVWGYEAAAGDRARDVGLARLHWQTCQDAGVTLPVTTTLYVPPIPRPYLPDPAALGAAIQADLAVLSLTVEIASPDWQSEWLPDVHAGRADLFLLGWTGISGDPDSFLCPLFCGDEGAFNTTPAGQPAPPDAELAALLQQARETVDPTARAALYAQAQARIFEVAPAVPLAHRQTSWAFRAGVEGYTPSPIDSVFFYLHGPPS